ncbi:MAG TPA: DUF1566 domain-containing protein [Candidatus Competibacter sp.]|nr:DUF1566 domain-containing protein [Candidatus Competibacteraceae bacterium]HPE72285.1 DUF1566 domain-containing protein [Candidatus Competibacter sp.]HRW65143.1 DUF1566 domain-containing protein [Candidatus Competibacter sp.]
MPKAPPRATMRRAAGHFLATAGLLASLSLPRVVTAAGLNDTGQSLCYNGSSLVACDATNTGDAATYPRQDGRYGRDAAATVGALTKIGGGAAGFDFTALDAAGQATMPSSGPTPHPCVRDNVTGLTWEVKTDDNGLRDKDWTYTWYSTDVATNGGNAGSNSVTTTCGTLASCNTQDYAVAVNAAALCGFTDWRLPSIRELQTLVHYGAANPTIDTTYFPNTLASRFWSAASAGPYPANAWNVNFVNGVSSVYAYGKADGGLARLVRGGQF